MTAIKLSILRCPDDVVAEERSVRGGELIVGRGSDCGWRLRDEAKQLSKRHCVIEFYQGGWQVRDLSQNGTFINDQREPIGQDQVRSLFDGDRLRLGPYEMEVRLVAGAARGDALRGGQRPAPDVQPARFPDPFAPSPFAASTPIPDHFDPLLESAAPMPDVAVSSSEAFLPPRPAFKPASIIPDEWDELLEGLGPHAPASPVVQPPSAQRPATTDADAESFGAQQAPRLPEGLGAATGDGTGLDEALRVLLRGAGIANPPSVDDPRASLAAAGAMLRAVTAGLRALLVARADIKREFRIEQTVLRLGQNNALKFAADDEHALLGLLASGPTLPVLVQEAINDLLEHQVATLDATQVAARALLEQLAPAAIEGGVEGGGLLPGSRERRLWEAYRRHHADVSERLEDDFDSVFGRAFARAYEMATARRDD